ncbi:sensor histidine kinase [Puia sp.]|uniref:sensor histidine kinase n=1 Tax=Puia sp. TaxID=2045100 RepID=UPI002F3E9C04
MKKLLLLLLLPVAAHAQIDWPNYSTSFQGNGKEGSHPVLVTAIPYNGIYGGATYFSAKPDQLHLADSFYAPDERRPRYIGESNTIDSGKVYFLAPGIHRENADRYEFRVIVDGKYVLQPWSPITQFVDSGKELNEFKPGYGFLGGYAATWGHSLLVDIREKATKTIESTAVVYWRSARPTLSGIYTAGDLQSFVASKREDWNWKPDPVSNSRLKRLLAGNLELRRNENSLLFFVAAEVYQRQAIEYQLVQDGAVTTAWRQNNFDNNILFLQDLPPGEYKLQVRLRAQRHNVSDFSFRIDPAWYETKSFRLFLGALQGSAAVAVILLFILLRQRRRARREKAARQKLDLELGYIRSQLNPHFIFNALSSIQGLVNRKELDAANRYLADFGNLLRDSLALSDQDAVELPQEIRILDTYLQLEQLRFGFRYEIITDADLSAVTTGIPAFLLQPIVENAVKHGVASRQAAGFIRVHFSRENGNFIAEVADNGKGWDTTSETTGYGLRLTAERIRLLNQLSLRQPITMTILSQPDAGTTIRLHFSNWWT